jgi:hypothetical protein
MASPFVMDRSGPPRMEKSRTNEDHEEIAQRRRVKDVGVEDGDNGMLHQ